ncbi:MAG TPA: aminotransferase class V-fold PLP-dependent enzyme [Candidatus Limnocylindrales bacterium]|nr:aminotransferase class V-fold PLP-dependent enzyme [Candidatus Limnocylindrales bacterium]
MTDRDALLRRTAGIATEFLAGLPTRPVGRPVDLAALRADLDGPLPDGPMDPATVIEELARGADAGLFGTAGPRYFGFVIGGGVPAALAADWLTSAWDQNGALYAISPAAAVAEEVAGRWLVELFGLPAQSSVGFVTGATMATFTALAAARHRVLQRAGWNVEEDGYVGAPPIEVVVGDEAHVTVFVSLQMLGLGRARVHRVAADEQGRMRAGALRETLAALKGPIIVSAQSGNVNTGAFDPLPEIVAAVREKDNAWLHVDGAFGLWAAATPALHGLTEGVADADSWTTDAHKWLNVPYDSGIVICADAAAHHKAMTLGASYYVETQGGERDNYNWVPESSRRARGFAIYAALRSLGRAGLAEMIERCCANARRFADGLRGTSGVAILNDVVLNQVLVRFSPPGLGDDPVAADDFTRRVIAAVQADGTCWLGGSTWHGMAVMRISVSNWSTTEADVDLSIEAILRCARDVAGASAVRA